MLEAREATEGVVLVDDDDLAFGPAFNHHGAAADVVDDVAADLVALAQDFFFLARFDDGPAQGAVHGIDRAQEVQAGRDGQFGDGVHRCLRLGLWFGLGLGFGLGLAQLGVEDVALGDSGEGGEGFAFDGGWRGGYNRSLIIVRLCGLAAGNGEGRLREKERSDGDDAKLGKDFESIQASRGPLRGLLCLQKPRGATRLRTLARGRTRGETAVGTRIVKWGAALAALAVAGVCVAVAVGPARVLRAALDVRFMAAGVTRHQGVDAGRAVSWYEGGGGPAILLLHGAGADAASSWYSLLPALAGRYRVLAPELGFDEPAAIEAADAVGLEINRVRSVMRLAGVRRAVVVGLSAGAWLGLRLAAEDADLVAAVVAVAPAGPQSERAPAPGGRIRRRPRRVVRQKPLS